LTVLQTPPDADATKYFAALFGSTANPITRPEVNAGPNDRNRNPLNVGDDIGSRWRASSSPGAGLFVSGVADGCGLGVGVACALFSGCAAASVGQASSRQIEIGVSSVRGKLRGTIFI